jgi:hypothetical protein
MLEIGEKIKIMYKINDIILIFIGIYINIL